jgi:DeoR/GlpR family transcriptional regulator of sugar metabolism
MKEGLARRQRILELVHDGMVGVEALSDALQISASTIRRDLAQLSATGKLLRTYGGAAPSGQEQPVQQRAASNRAEKRAIARLAAGLVLADDTIILDAGTTTGALAAELARRPPLRVVTNGLTAINALAGAAGIELVVLGGRLRQISQGMIGPLAEHALERITARATFLGADGVVAGRGLCEASDEQASLKALMVAQADQLYVLADADKLGLAASHAWTLLPRPWTLITDHRATAALLEPFRKLGHVTIMVAPPGP